MVTFAAYYINSNGDSLGLALAAGAIAFIIIGFILGFLVGHSRLNLLHYKKKRGAKKK